MRHGLLRRRAPGGLSGDPKTAGRAGPGLSLPLGPGDASRFRGPQRAGRKTSRNREKREIGFGRHGGKGRSWKAVEVSTKGGGVLLG